MRILNAPPSAIDVAGDVAILLSVKNGARFLPDQLASLCAQTDCHWRLVWRDDCSTDASAAIVSAFVVSNGIRATMTLEHPPEALGAGASYFRLLRAARGAEAVAFADQDDVWLPDKLARGLAALRREPPTIPVLYCARQVLVDATLRRIGVSETPRRPPGFLPALTQNIATGCTVMMNEAARALVARSTPPAGALHDWWSYLVVAGAAGRIIVDPTPVILYRQHGANLIGARASAVDRAFAALRRGPAAFMSVLREHVLALRAQPELLTDEARSQLEVVADALGRPPWARLGALALHGLRRQGAMETLLFRLWFLAG